MVDPAGSSTLCLECVDALDVTGAGIMLITNGGPRSVLCSTDSASETVEELQFTLGEGPCLDVCATGLPVLEPDLDAAGLARWPTFTPPAMRAGVRAIFGFPLHVGSIRLGALDVYNDRPGDLREDQLAAALNLAGMVTRRVLDLQADVEPGDLATDLDRPDTLRASVHQASGMLSARFDIEVGDALLRLRAYAYASERPINDVARDVLERRLSIE